MEVPLGGVEFDIKVGLGFTGASPVGEDGNFDRGGLFGGGEFDFIIIVDGFRDGSVDPGADLDSNCEGNLDSNCGDDLEVEVIGEGSEPVDVSDEEDLDKDGLRLTDANFAERIALSSSVVSSSSATKRGSISCTRVFSK